MQMAVDERFDAPIAAWAMSRADWFELAHRKRLRSRMGLFKHSDHDLVDGGESPPEADNAAQVFVGQRCKGFRRHNDHAPTPGRTAVPENGCEFHVPVFVAGGGREGGTPANNEEGLTCI